MLIYPHIQSVDFQLPSMLQNAEGPLLTRRMTAFFTATYLDGHGEKIDMFLRNEHVSDKFKKMGLPHLDIGKLPAKYARRDTPVAF